MNHEPTRSPSAITRRTALAGPGAGALGLALAPRGLGASAQDATPVATPFPLAGHPVIGVWQITLEAGNPGSAVALFYFGEGGEFTVAASENNIHVGAWRATGER